MAARGVILSYEAVRDWCRKFGQAYANQLRRRRPRPGDTWHLDEVFLTINGQRQMSSSYSHRILAYSQKVSARRPCSSHRIPAESGVCHQADASVAGAYDPGHTSDAVLLAGTTSPAPRETASLACAAPPSPTCPRSADEGSTPWLDPTSPLSLLAQEVLDLLDQRRRAGSVRLGHVRRLATRRVIVLL
jgi:hypothetical protein